MAPNIATNTKVDLEGLLEFLRPRHKALLTTRRTDDGPQTSPVVCGVDAEGRIVVSTYPERAKTRNARKDPRVSVVVLSDDFDGPWVQVDGTAEVLDGDGEEAVEPLVEYFRVISGEHPDWDEYREAMRRQGKALVRVTPERWGPVATGGFPADRV
ncbi:PPOX class F420-dependent oxidoreductase [Nocardiopsis oceani]